jgi:hypothetical protein
MFSRHTPEQAATIPSREALITAGLLECVAKGEEEWPDHIWQTYLKSGDMFYVIARSKLEAILHRPATDTYTFQAMNLSDLSEKYPVYRYEAYSEDLTTDPWSRNALALDEDWDTFERLVNDARTGEPTNQSGELIDEAG